MKGSGIREEISRLLTDFYLEYWWYSDIIALQEKRFSVKEFYFKGITFIFILLSPENWKRNVFLWIEMMIQSIFFTIFQLLPRQCLQTAIQPIMNKYFARHFLLHPNKNPKRVLNVIQQQIQEIYQQILKSTLLPRSNRTLLLQLHFLSTFHPRVLIFN